MLAAATDRRMCWSIESTPRGVVYCVLTHVGQHGIDAFRREVLDVIRDHVLRPLTVKLDTRGPPSNSKAMAELGLPTMSRVSEEGLKYDYLLSKALEGVVHDNGAFGRIESI